MVCAPRDGDEAVQARRHIVEPGIDTCTALSKVFASGIAQRLYCGICARCFSGGTAPSPFDLEIT